MANGILRKGTLGIAWEGDDYGDSPVNPEFFIPVIDLTWEEHAEVIENNAMVGSTYEVNDTDIAFRLTNFSFTTKIHEDLFPIFLLQKFDISSQLVAGESAVYKHTMTYLQSNAGGSYSLYWDDPDRGDVIAAGAKFESVTLTGEQGQYLTLEVVGKAKAVVDGSATIPVTAKKEFTSSHLNFEFAEYGDALAAYKLLTISVALNTPLSDESENIGLGSSTLDELNTLADRFEVQATSKMPNYDMRDLYTEGADVKSEIEIIDTNRFVAGSTQSTRPSIKISNPIQKFIAWTREGGADELVKQNFTLLNIDMPGIADAPMIIEVVNAVDEYYPASS